MRAVKRQERPCLSDGCCITQPFYVNCLVPGSECPYCGVHKGKRAPIKELGSLSSSPLADWSWQWEWFRVTSLRIQGWTRWLLKVLLNPACPSRQRMSRLGVSHSALCAFSFPSLPFCLLFPSSSPVISLRLGNASSKNVPSLSHCKKYYYCCIFMFLTFTR